MRLRRESHEEIPAGSHEYKVAVKSVIRDQIQSLLKKLASVTGEESIVISTNVNTGTYNHLGSNIGQEYLDDGDEFIQTICSRFTDFCANVQGQRGSYSITRPEILSNNQGQHGVYNISRSEVLSSNTKRTLPAPRKTPRKRAFTSYNDYSPPNKRVAFQQYSPESAQNRSNNLRNTDNTVLKMGENSDHPSSHIMGDNSEKNTEIRGDISSHLNENNNNSSQMREDNNRSSQTMGDNSSSQIKGDSSSQIKGDNSSSQIKGDNSSSQIKGDNSSSQIKGDSSSQNKGENNHSSQTSKDNPCYVLNFPWIKSEPVDDYCPVVNGNSDQESTEETSSMSITNRPRSLIPLANIFKKYGTKSTKPEPSVTPESLPGTDEKDEELASEKSILRSLYEQPLYYTEDYNSGGANDGEKSSHMSINLPHNLSDSLENFPSASENLVLSGYYDSENYPSYRHSRKHPSNNSTKKSKSKDKLSSSAGSSPVPGSASLTHIPESLTTVPSSSDLKMRMFESGGRLVYACDVCKRELSHLTSYRRHMKLHTMDRPHKCPVCTKGFIRKYHCIDHLNKHHKGVDFDPDTLTLRGSFKGLEESSAFSESLSISPGEYNYTLDTSIDDADESLNASCGIDQSASSMLSELAKSAQKAHLLGEIGANSQSHSELKDIIQLSRSGNSSEAIIKSDTSENSLEAIKVENELSTSFEENGSEKKELLPNKPSPYPVKSENSAMARKHEVNQGIKDIVAHLKSSSKKKKMCTENEHPVDKA